MALAQSEATMSDAKLIIAKELIEILAKQPCSIERMSAEKRDLMAVKLIIEAARKNYVLPPYCAEMNTKAGKCINCIIEGTPPAICLKKIEENNTGDLDLDIDWDDS